VSHRWTHVDKAKMLEAQIAVVAKENAAEDCAHF
jgi:hypothetical protein